MICCVGWQAGDGKPVSDQWLPPFVIVDDDKKPVGTVEDGDAVVSSPPICSEFASSKLQSLACAPHSAALHFEVDSKAGGAVLPLRLLADPKAGGSSTQPTATSMQRRATMIMTSIQYCNQKRSSPIPSWVLDSDVTHLDVMTSAPLQVLFNFRADRMVEISKAFEYEEFGAFDRKRWPKARCCH